MKILLTKPSKNTQESINDKFEIKELLEFERFCRDNAVWDEMHKCYADDSRVLISWYQGTGHGFVEASKNMKDRAPHKIYNTEIWLHGDKAVAIMQATIEKRDDVDGFPVDLRSDAKLVFRVQRTSEQWKIKAFDSIYEQDALVPAYPGSRVNIPIPEIQKFRKSYACLSYMLSRSGYKIDENLAGIDRPELVEKLYNEVDTWLCE